MPCWRTPQSKDLVDLIFNTIAHQNNTSMQVGVLAKDGAPLA